MSGLTIRVNKRGSRGSDTLLEAANRILRLLGVSSTKRGKQPSPKTKVRSTTPRVCVYPTVVFFFFCDGLKQIIILTRKSSSCRRKESKLYVFV